MISRLVSIDSRVGDYETLIAGLPQGSEWFLLYGYKVGAGETGRMPVNN